MTSFLNLALTFLFILLIPQPFAFESKNVFVVWNVGQGLWTTYVDADACLHFDMGGERVRLEPIKNLCKDKENFVFLSHFDRDHISFLSKGHFQFGNLCLAAAPLIENTRHGEKFDDLEHHLKKIEKVLKIISFCSADKIENLKSKVMEVFNPTVKKTSNDVSLVQLILGHILAPGDSGQAQEKYWGQDRHLRNVTLLVLGHHGSRTSTLESTLDNMPHLQTAIASARKKKYGHPHGETLQRLKNHGVSVLETEKWGSLFFETN